METNGMKEWRERQKLEKVGRQAMNLRMVEVVMRTADSEGNPVENEGYTTLFIYNLETITEEEVATLLNRGDYMFDNRLLRVDPETAANIFPHMGESDKDKITAYWKPSSIKGYCRCSACGFKTHEIEAVAADEKSGRYTKARYRFCPNCGSPMHHEQKKNNQGE